MVSASTSALAALVGVTPAFFLHLPNGSSLRSLTLNPSFADDDDPDKAIRILTATAFVRERIVNARSLAAILWFEAQITPMQEQVEINGLEIYVSRAFELSKSKIHALRTEISRSLSIVNATTRRQSQGELEAAFGVGTRACVERHDYPTKANSNLVAIRRPLYTREDVHHRVCYFCVPTLQNFVDHPDFCSLSICLLPIDKTTNIPVQQALKIGSDESIAFWFPLLYPQNITDLTRDERRYLTLRAAWPKQDSAVKTELLAFPRIATKYRLSGSYPEFKVSPNLRNDPAVWSGGLAHSFVLETEKLEVKTLSNHDQVGMFLTLEDTSYKDLRLIQQVWASIFFGVIANAFFAAGLGFILADVVDKVTSGVALMALSFVLFVLVLRLLLPRAARAQREP